jgi:hypothetical protein
VWYLPLGRQPTDNPSPPQDLATELTKHATRVCPIECKTGDEKPAAAPATASKSDEDDNARSRRKQPTATKSGNSRDVRSPRLKRRLFARALARPSIVSGGGASSPSRAMPRW